MIGLSLALPVQRPEFSGMEVLRLRYMLTLTKARLPPALFPFVLYSLNSERKAMTGP
jgi:hypothetical protein